MNETTLAGLFEKLGAPRPNEWAHSQASERIPQLARFLFLREAWKLVIDRNDQSWIGERLSGKLQFQESTSSALKRVLGRGVTAQELTAVVRAMQSELLYRLCYLIDEGPGAAADVEDEVMDVAWSLFQVNADTGEPVAQIPGLHESVYELDSARR